MNKIFVAIILVIVLVICGIAENDYIINAYQTKDRRAMIEIGIFYFIFLLVCVALVRGA